MKHSNSPSVPTATAARVAAFLVFMDIFALRSTPAAEPLHFNRDIRPILSDACFHCHGPDEKARRGGLRLDLAEHATRPAESGEIAVVPGDLSKSTLVARIESADESQRMPPPNSAKQLTSSQKEKLKQWVTQGAPFERHWSFLPLGPVPLPEVKRSEWPRNEVDRFILATLEREGLAPATPVGKETLIRRVSLDLLGLPPALADVEAFLADTSENAYEKVVDRILQSPQFGERLASDWLDAARYADSNGYQVDRDRELWPWRDWVIDAFNRDLPFDQFTIEQLAGDLLPNATLEQRVATGFHRNHMLNEEGGIIEEEFLAEYTADRVETTAAVWLGQTFSCCRCHDHKYDPFTQRDYYSLKAFFHNVPERGVGNYSSPIRRNAPPFVRLPAPAIESKIRDLEQQRTIAETQLAAISQEVSADLESWAQRTASANVAWSPVNLVSVESPDLLARLDAATQSIHLEKKEPNPGVKTLKIIGQISAANTTSMRIELSAAAPASLNWHRFRLSRRQPSSDKPDSLRLRPLEVSEAQSPTEGEKVVDADAKSQWSISLQPDKPVVSIWTISPEIAASLNPNATPNPGVPNSIEIMLECDVEVTNGSPRCQVATSSLPTDELLPANIAKLVRREKPASESPGAWTPAERKQLIDFRLSRHAQHGALTAQIEELNKQIAAADLEIPTSLVMEEMKEPRATFVLMRGVYDKPGPTVTVDTPSALPAFASDLPRNRLGLAKWLVSPQNPLPARVTVNRLWQSVFGTGLVKTSEDFGAQGSPPSHPELLDWLAFEFIHRGWDIKQLLRTLVTSETYRQSSRVTPELWERDPENRWLARAPRYRLQGEFIRDQALAVSGLLDTRLGGPSVKPYHPPGLYEQVTAGSGYNVYVPGKGSELRRRSLYTYWKRSVPHPGMLLFDASFRESCVLRRPRTNTPLQALNLLNDPTYVEAARFLAQRMIQDGGAKVESRLSHGFRWLLSREPRPAELAILSQALERATAEFRQDPAAAKSLLTVGDAGHDSLPLDELAAYTMVASELLNLDEAITRE